MNTRHVSPQETRNLFYGLVNFTCPSRIRREDSDNPQAHTKCPKCGGDKFDFSPNGAHCFRGSCNYSASLWTYAREIGYDLDSPKPLPAYTPKVKPQTPTYWQKNPQLFLDRYTSHPETIARWQEYKPLSVDTIAKYQLGYGPMPEPSRCQHNRLIVPIFQGEQITGFRGRVAVECDCPKWLTAKNATATLYGLDNVQPGDVVWWLENMIDALLLMQTSTRGYKAVASTAGAGTWKRFIDSVVERQPRLVIVALDNDLAGQPNSETFPVLVERHKQKTGQEYTQTPNGFLIYDALCKARLNVALWKWPAGSRIGADGMDLLKALDKC